MRKASVLCAYGGSSENKLITNKLTHLFRSFFSDDNSSISRHSALWKWLGRFVTFSAASCTTAELLFRVASSLVYHYYVSCSLLSFSVVTVWYSTWKTQRRNKKHWSIFLHLSHNFWVFLHLCCLGLNVAKAIKKPSITTLISHPWTNLYRPNA